MNAGQTHSKMRRHGVAIVLSGPSGAGKTTLYRRVLVSRPTLQFSVSCTTRAPRPAEVDGQDYFFITRDAFAQRLTDQAFIEHAEVHGNLYGTLQSEVDRRLAQGQDVLLDIDVQGARQIRAARAAGQWQAPATFVFVGPPSVAELERRLRGRATDDEATIRQRLAAARVELREWQLFDYLLINDDLATAVARLASIVQAAGLRTALLRDKQLWR